MRTLSEVRPTLPADWYYDADHYASELEAIWYRDWICVGRSESLQRDGDYFVVGLGTQSVIVTRLAEDRYHAFHNTCRHRGSKLCQHDTGRFRNGRIICPYHTWTYSLEGDLVATPGRFETTDFDAAHYPLYKVNVGSWRGFIFVNLAATPACSLEDFLDDEADTLRNWPLEELRSVHREVFAVACNWKLFWENYSECYHCPRVHPELCKVMPVYANGVFDFADLPDWAPQFDGDPGRGAVGGGAKTWTMDGQISLPALDGPTEAELQRGVAFSSFDCSLFVVAHPEYVRSVRMRPTGPESIELTVDWLLPSTFEIESPRQIDAIVELARTVVQQDGDICELNQRGLHSKRHQAGVLMPQEYELWNFHERIRQKLADVQGEIA